MKLEKAAELLREYHYEKNGIEDTIDFLRFIIIKLEKGE
jgi:hypothetical protein